MVVSRTLFRGVGRAPCSAPDPEARPSSRKIGSYDNMGSSSPQHGPKNCIPDRLRVLVTQPEPPVDLGIYWQISFWVVEARGSPALLEGLRGAVMKAAVGVWGPSLLLPCV